MMTSWTMLISLMLYNLINVVIKPMIYGADILDAIAFVSSQMS